MLEKNACTVLGVGVLRSGSCSRTLESWHTNASLVSTGLAQYCAGDFVVSEFVDYLRDVFAAFGQVNARKMFGGHGIYFDDCMFGLVADDTLYLKADEQNVHRFNELDLPAFEYTKSDGRPMKMSFFLAPESIYEDHEEAAEWATHAWEAAKRAKALKKNPARKKVSKKKVGNKKAAKKVLSKKPSNKKMSSKKAVSNNQSKKSNRKSIGG